jgi:hypothetical protein
MSVLQADIDEAKRDLVAAKVDLEDAKQALREATSDDDKRAARDDIRVFARMVVSITDRLNALEQRQSAAAAAASTSASTLAAAAASSGASAHLPHSPTSLPSRAAFGGAGKLTAH